MDFRSARLCSTCYAKDYGPELCHCFVVGRDCKLLEGDQDLGYPACEQLPFTLRLDRTTFPATTIALSVRDATGEVVYADTTKAQIDSSHGEDGVECSGPSSAAFAFNFYAHSTGGMGGAAGTGGTAGGTASTGGTAGTGGTGGTGGT